MKSNDLNWQERAQEEIYETIKDMTLAEELDYWQQETARMRTRRQQKSTDPNIRTRLTELIKDASRRRSSTAE